MCLTFKINDDVIPMRDSGDYIYIKGIDPNTLIGRNFNCEQDDGTILHTHIETCLDQHNQLRDKKFKIVDNDQHYTYLPTDRADELITYNDIMNCLHHDQLEDGKQIWKFCSILAQWVHLLTKIKTTKRAATICSYWIGDWGANRGAPE